ncbi:M91 family zinc metallopeptidase [Pseudomonas sp. S1_E04]
MISPVPFAPSSLPPALGEASSNAPSPTLKAPPRRRPSHDDFLGRFTSASRLTSDQYYVQKYPKYVNTTPVFQDDQIKVSYESTWLTEKKGPPFNEDGRFVIETGDKDDRIDIQSLPNNEIGVKVNGRPYQIKLPRNDFFLAGLHVKSKGGDDAIRVDPSVNIPVTIEAGSGRDRIDALGSGEMNVYGGAGDDEITLGRGTSYAEGNDGNDTIRGGTGKAVIYGNNGNDRLFSGVGGKGTFAHVDGGNGNDLIVSQSPFTVAHGGAGDDLMIGTGRTTFYTGQGRDVVLSRSTNDKIFATAGDRISRVVGSTLKQVKIDNNAGKAAFNIVGSDAFKQRTEDDLALLRSSPTAQKMLAELDNAAQRNGAPIDLKETEAASSNYAYANDFTRKKDDALEDYEGIEESPQLGFIENDQRGAAAKGASVHHNAKFTNPHYDALPINSLYHELSHAYNGANGTLLPGRSNPPGEDYPVPNLELQALGQETNAPAFDIDNAPSTPPTNTNPKALTENGLREEMGFPLRTRYYMLPNADE